MLPISLLSEPSSSCLVREKDDKFIVKLKKEMMENPVNDVQPIMCMFSNIKVLTKQNCVFSCGCCLWVRSPWDNMYCHTPFLKFQNNCNCVFDILYIVVSEIS